MRTIFAFLLGVAATIGGAYLHDTAVPQPGPGTSKPLVNWDAVGELSRWGANRAREEWNRLTAK